MTLKSFLKWKAIPLIILLSSTNIPKGNPQENSLTTNEYFFDFIRNDVNRLETFGNHSVLSDFFSQLRMLEIQNDRKVHILHIGDSHIQADFFSGKVRNMFYEDRRFPMSGRGFVFPYRAAHTNNPNDYKVSYTGVWNGNRSSISRHYSRWGISGITATTYSSKSTITINPNINPEQPYEFNRVKVFYPNQSKSQFRVKLKLNEGNNLHLHQKDIGMEEFILDKPQESVTIAMDRQKSTQKHFVMQGIMFESDNPGIIYSATGVNGAKASSFGRCADLSNHIGYLNPDLVIVSLGTNDAYSKPFDKEKFRSHYSNLLSEIRKHSPDVNILLTTPGDNYRYKKYLNYDNDEARIVIGELAIKYKAAVWDFYTVMGGLKSIDYWFANGMAGNDRLHLTKKGYELQGELFYHALNNAYRNFSDSVKMGTLLRHDKKQQYNKL